MHIASLQVPRRCRCHAPQGRITGAASLQVPCTSGPYNERFLPATAHLISPVSATAGTVPGNSAVVAVSVDSSVCDDSTVQPAAAVTRLPPCPRGLSPVPHRMMRIPIKSSGFSLQVPCTSRPYNGRFFPATAHLISPVSATAGTVPGNGTVVAVSVDSSVCDDSTIQPAAAVTRLPPCPRGLSPVPHRMMGIPIKSLGFSL